MQNISPKSWEALIKAKYGESEALLITFNPANQITFVKHEERCFTGSAPTLSQVKKVYGDKVAHSWLFIQLNDLNEFAGTEKKMSIDQMKEATQTFTWKYHYLKLAELMLFFQLFKAGEFGHFYGCVDSMRIGEALQTFLAYRSNKLDQYMRKQNSEKIEAWRNDPQNMSYEQYVEKHKNDEL